MSWDTLYTQAIEPTYDQIGNFIGSCLWNDLNTFLNTTYNTGPKKTYSRCSAQRGWNVKYQKSGKSLCTLYPMQGYFIALVVIGTKEETETDLIIPTCSTYIQELYNKTPFSCGGKWLMIEVKDEETLKDIEKLIKIRVKPKNS